MSDFKHTSGKWKVSYVKFSEVTAENGAIIATCKRLRSLTEMEANANFIAAAPELLAAHELGEKVESLFAALTSDGRLDCRNPWVITLCGAIGDYQTARIAAIAKATGGAA